MPDYRLYFIGLDGHFRRAEPISAADDIAAMAAAREFTDGSELELWEGDRKIIAFASDQSLPISPPSASALKRLS